MAESQMGQIQWYPGHMAKTRRLIESNISLVDGVVEILDARIPESSRNPEMTYMLHQKPRMFLLNKADMADPERTKQWLRALQQKEGAPALATDCRSGKGLQQFENTVKTKLLPDLLQKRQEKGMGGAPIRLMVVGIPNVGKSSFINRMAKSKQAKVGDRPGVTRDKQWVKLGGNMELLDMPGILWPKFDDQAVAQKLAFTGAIKDDIMDVEGLASLFLELLAKEYPQTLTQRYHFTPEELTQTGYEMLEDLGRHRGMLLSGGEINTERAAIALLDEYRGGKLGRITLETPEECEAAST